MGDTTESILESDQLECDEESTSVDLVRDLKHHNMTSEPEGEQNTPRRSERNTTKTEGEASSLAQCSTSRRDSESDDSDLATLNTSENEENNIDTKEGENLSTTNQDEEEGTYEELICLVRQFYVEKPINPAALAHQNIETC